ncbi:uncharacterized protein V1518DRAFT_418233 [Limtongia smithiae]|uniref:uncharacterized protein n=1 Tax=Limtongia smithiae TaxID=1125753 RepID=UPI0034CD90D5
MHDTASSALSTLNKYSRRTIAWNLSSRMIMAATGLLSRAFLYGFHNVETSGVKEFVSVLERAKREGRGILTIANHISVIDDPLLWGLLPLRKMLNPADLRWGLGAENICFTTKVTSKFFSLGQVLPTWRFGTGPFQGAVDTAVFLVSPPPREIPKPYDPTKVFPPDNLHPQWIHIFPESLVHQAYAPHNTTMKYFHWGVSRVVLEPERLPIIVPIYHDGLQEIFPEDRVKLKYVPRTLIPRFRKKDRINLRFGFGEALDDDLFEAERQKWKSIAPEAYDSEDARALRSQVAAKLRESVIQLRAKMGYPPEDDRFKDHKFWSGINEESGIKVAGKYGNSKVTVIEKEG